MFAGATTERSSKTRAIAGSTACGARPGATLDGGAAAWRGLGAHHEHRVAERGDHRGRQRRTRAHRERLVADARSVRASPDLPR